MPTSTIGHRTFETPQQCRFCGERSGNQFEDGSCGNCGRNGWYADPLPSFSCYNCGSVGNATITMPCGICNTYPWHERPNQATPEVIANTTYIPTYTCGVCNYAGNVSLTNMCGGCSRVPSEWYMEGSPPNNSPIDTAINEVITMPLSTKTKKKEEPSNVKVEIPEKNFIDMIGIELEGGWDKMPAGEENHGDGSVYCKSAKQVGEIASEPFKNVNDCLAWIDRCYPEEVNKTCGLHIHISFVDKLSYMQLMNKAFYRYFLAECVKWGKAMKINAGSEFWRRLEGKNSYCRKQFNPDRQSIMRSKEGCRYTHLNYCFGLYGTLECRLFPMFKKKALVLEAVKFFYVTCNTFLANQKGERVFRSKVEDTYEDIIIEEKLCVS